MMTGAFLAMAMQLLPAPDALAWEPLTTDPEGEMFLAPATLEREGDVVRFVVRSDYRAGGPTDWGRTLLRVAVDCRRRLSAIVEGDAYGRDGRFAESRNAPAEALRFEPLGSTESDARLFSRVCGAGAAQEARP